MKNKKNFERCIPDISLGLSTSQVQERINCDATNKTNSKTSKSYLQIILSNTFNFFSCLLFGIAIIFIICNTGVFEPYIPANYFSITKFSFLVILFANILIGTIQEIRSKIVLEKLKLISKHKYKVIRNGKTEEITNDNIVLDDIILLSSGDQIPADCKILDGFVQVDESVLTGESETIKKIKDDTLLSGSIIISGSVVCLVTCVGNETYAMKIQNKVKEISKNKSELMKNIYGIIKVMAAIVVLMIIITVSVLYYKMTKWNTITWAEIVSSTATIAVGLIPTGLVLLTSVTLAVSIISLVKKKVLIQELYSLEGLSKVNTICLDKTGTLTTGNMKVFKVISFNKKIKIADYIGTLLNSITDRNATMMALIKYFSLNSKFKVKEVYPFTSETKCSKIILDNGSSIVLGAPEFILDKNKYFNEFELMNKYTEQGLRVLALTVNDELSAFICLEDEIRPAAVSTIKYFNENGVDVKIISGDNPITVSDIARRCGVNNYDKIINMQNVSIDDIPNIVDDFTIFGRITPEQKEAVVKALQLKNRKVAMTGDGVNDLLALKAANTSISFNSATDAAKELSDVVLLDNSFDHIPDVVKEGRRVVSNITRTAVLFLTKTFFLIFFSLFSIPTKNAVTVLSIENLSIFEAVIIALSGFLLSVENSKTPITSTFKKTVYPKAIASGLLCAFSAVVVIFSYTFGALGLENDPVTLEVEQSLMTILINLSGLAVLVVLCYPFNRYRFGVIVLAIILTAGAFITYPSLFLNVDSSGLSLSEVLYVISHPFNLDASIFVYFPKAAYIIIIAFILAMLPVYVFVITFINWLLKRSFIQKINYETKHQLQNMMSVFNNKNKKK